MTELIASVISQQSFRLSEELNINITDRRSFSLSTRANFEKSFNDI